MKESEISESAHDPPVCPDWVGSLLDDFLPALGREIPVDVRERLAIEAWLQTALRQGWLFDGAEQARVALRSIVAKTPQEQEKFDAVFDEWLRPPALTQSQTPPFSVNNGSIADESNKIQSGWKRWFSMQGRNWVRLLLAGALVGFAWAVWWWFAGSSEQTTQQVVNALPGTLPVPASGSAVDAVIISSGASGWKPLLPDFGLLWTHPAIYIVLLVLWASNVKLFNTYTFTYLILLCVVILMFLPWGSTRRLKLARLATRKRLVELDVYARELLPVSGERRRLLREAARSLRRPVATESRGKLNLPASVRASAAAAGLFHVIRRAEPVTPEYLVLIDRAGMHDQQAHWSAEIARDLAFEGVSLAMFEYDHDPRWVAPLRMTRSTVSSPSVQRFQSLHTLAAQHGGRGLIVIGDGAGCIDPLTGLMAPGVQAALRPWPKRVLLTPRPASGWGVAEAVLAGDGSKADVVSFLVLPLQIGSLVGASGWLRAGIVPNIDVVPGAPGPYPMLLAEDPDRWLGREPPDAQVVASMVLALRRYLGSVAFGWLAASAVYPLLSPDLTGLLARQLTLLAHGMADDDELIELLGDARLHEVRLMAIAQLPWCRAGYMPDWLRGLLFESLPPLQRERVRALMVALLRKAAGSGHDARLSLGRIAQDEMARSRRVPAWLWHRLHGLALLTGLPADSPLRDVIYLGVLYRKFDRVPVLDAPEELVRAVKNMHIKLHASRRILHGVDYFFQICAKEFLSPEGRALGVYIFFRNISVYFGYPGAYGSNVIGLNYFDNLLKRVFDLLFVFLISPLMFPIMLAVALAVRLSTGKPVIYGQVRVGRRGEEFKCYKFRSMVTNSDEVLKYLLDTDPEARAEWNRDFMLKNDPRITRVGRFIRKTSLDELPQLWNVLRGDMSVVGPRPVVRQELDRYYESAREHYLSVPPGITGLWQVSGGDDLDYAERVRLDRHYVDNWNIWTDCTIVIRSILQMVKRLFGG